MTPALIATLYAAGETSTATYPNFAGYLSQVILNGLDVLELDRDQLLAGVERNAEYVPPVGPHIHSDSAPASVVDQSSASSSSVISFPSRAAFLGLPQMRAYLDLSLRLAFRTREATGLLVYNAGRRNDFLAVELVDGHVHLVASIGGRTVELKDNYPEVVNDNQWHVLLVARTGKNGRQACPSSRISGKSLSKKLK